jgi:hypothetical protein
MQVIHRILELIGGMTIVVGSVSLFFSNLIRDYFKEHWKNKGDIDTDKAKGLNAIERIQPEHYAAHQYEVCIELWNLLADVRTAVDSLWESVTNENIVALSQQIEVLQHKLYAWSLFFEDQHQKQLEEAIHTLADFSAGKTLLWQLRSLEDIKNNSVSIYSLERQIKKNHDFKRKFEALINDVQNSLRNKLSGTSFQKKLGVSM